MLYHATYLAHYKSIREKGLIPGCRKNWSFSKDDVVYLAPTPELACSFAETAEEAPENIYESGIICLGIPLGSLDQALLSSVSGVPTTFFFDGEGAYLGGVVGAAEKSDWEEIIHGLLEE